MLVGNTRGAPCLPVGTDIAKVNADSESGLLCDLPSWFYVILFFLFFFKGQGMVNASQILFYFFLVKSFYFRKIATKSCLFRLCEKKSSLPTSTKILSPELHPLHPVLRQTQDCFSPSVDTQSLLITFLFCLVNSCSGLAIWSAALPVFGYLCIKGAKFT